MNENAPEPYVGEPPHEYVIRVAEYLAEPDRRRLGIGTLGHVREAIAEMRDLTVAHLLTLDVSDRPTFGLSCVHRPDDEHWWSEDERGFVDRDCWLRSWWENCGEGMLARHGWPDSPSFPMPVKPWVDSSESVTMLYQGSAGL